MKNNNPPSKKANCVSISIALILLLFIIIFLERSLVVNDETSEDCSYHATPTNQDQYIFQFRSWWSFHWEYQLNDDFVLRLTCPTQVKNVNLYYKNNLIAQSDAQIFQLSDREKYSIYDCNGKHLYVISSGGFFQKILTPRDYIIEEPDGSVLSFIKTTDFIESLATYEITNSNGQVIGKIKNQAFPSRFIVTLLQPDDPGVDLRAIGLLFSQKSFLGFGPKHRDFCNTMISGHMILIGIVLVVGILVGIFAKKRNMYK